jgi:hypothetical protein
MAVFRDFAEEVWISSRAVAHFPLQCKDEHRCPCHPDCIRAGCMQPSGGSHTDRGKFDKVTQVTRTL